MMRFALFCWLLASALPAEAAVAPPNLWPDPQYAVQDQLTFYTAEDDELTGTIAPILVTANSTGSNRVTFFTRDTGELEPGDLIQAQAGAPPQIAATWLRVTSVAPNRSFTATTEYASGIPTTSSSYRVLIVQHADVTGADGSIITSSVWKFADGVHWPLVWISARPAHTRRLRGMNRVLIFSKVTAGPEYMFTHSTGRNLRSMGGQAWAVGAAVYIAPSSPPGCGAQAMINDGAVSTGPESTTYGQRVWLSHADLLPASPQVFWAGVRFSGPPGCTFVVGETTLTPSDAALPDGAFTTPKNQTIQALASVNPWLGLSLTTPPSGTFSADMQQASDGQINPGVASMSCAFEGQSDSVGDVLYTSSPGQRFGPVLQQGQPGPDGQGQWYAHAYGDFYIGGPIQDDPSDGTVMNLLSNGATSWRHLTLDCGRFLLNAGPGV